MPRIPTIFDNDLVSIFDSILTKFAQAAEPVLDKDVSDFVGKLLDNLSSELNKIQAPNTKDFTTPESFVDYLRNKNVEAAGKPVVADKQEPGYVEFKPDTFLNLDGLKELLTTYKDQAKEQAGIQGMYLSETVNHLIDQLKAKAGFGDIDKPVAVPVDQAKPEDQEKAKTNAPSNQKTPAQTPAAGTAAAPTAQQAEVAKVEQKLNITSADMIFPLPKDGNGEFDVIEIKNAIRKMLDLLLSTPSMYAEMASKRNALERYVENIELNADKFRQTANGAQDFVVSNSVQETVNVLKMLFNPTQLPQGATVGTLAAAQAVELCRAIVVSVDGFYTALSYTSIRNQFESQIVAQITSAKQLQALFYNVHTVLIQQDQAARTPGR